MSDENLEHIIILPNPVVVVGGDFQEEPDGSHLFQDVPPAVYEDIPPKPPEQVQVDEGPEHVLCVAGHVVEGISGVVFGVELDKILPEVMNPANHEFVDRDVAEQDPSRKQLIPYVLIRRGNQFYTYERSSKGAESRLHNKASLGVGGHINPCDGGNYKTALLREIKEELGLEDPNVSEPVAIIYDPSDEVGRVHLGVVHVIDVSFATSLVHTDPALHNGRFLHSIDIRQDTNSFENWSQLVIKNLL